VFQVVREGYRELGLRVFDPLGFNNSFALVMRKADAQKKGISKLSDLQPHAATLRMGLFGEFHEREDGLPGLVKAYGLRLSVRPREMDLGLLYQALLDGQVDLLVGSATDGLIAAHDLLVLEDDRRYFPPYDAVIVANEASLVSRPGLETTLGRLSGRIDEQAMRRLNHSVDGEHQDPRAVAAAFLRTLR
jgi:glycine betaine/choline ABC-type transport system substrate-binding protein